MNINIKNLQAVNQLFKRLNSIRRWTTFITEGKYDEISKQALNCCVCFVLAKESENRGVSINWERFPKIAIYRAFQKAYVNYDTPEHILKEICSMGDLSFEKVFSEVTTEIISECTDDDFVQSLKEGCGTNEEKIYQAATKIATFLELKEIQRNINGDYSSKYEEIVKSMHKYENIPGFDDLSDAEGNYFKFFSTISKLRNQNRWASYSYLVECSVLGHLFDTATFAYLMALEKGEPESVATKCFFMGIFHDIPEAFTRDIPSPIKDRIPGFRELTEKYELQTMEKYVYSFFSENVTNALKDIMMESNQNSLYKALMKGADYMSAVSEIWRQLKSGSRDEVFVSAIAGHKEKFDTGIAELTDSTKKLYDVILQYAESLGL